MKSAFLLGLAGIFLLLGGCAVVPYEPYGYGPVHGTVVIEGGGGGHGHYRQPRRHRHWR